MQKIAIVSPRLPMGGAVGGAETLLLNLAIGGCGGAVDDTAFPMIYEVDYVRVYQK